MWALVPGAGPGGGCSQLPTDVRLLLLDNSGEGEE